MKRYLYLQFKRNLKIFPLVCSVALTLLLCVSVILAGVANKNSEKHARLKIALSGDTQNELTQLGMAALRTFDDTRFSMELIELPEDEARAQLQSGNISAIVIFPDDFLDRALMGDVDQVTFITTPGAQSVVTLLKDELTKVVADIVIACEKGVYAVDDLITKNDLPSSAGQSMYDLSMAYVDMVFSRADVYVLTELGISHGVDIGQYYICSTIVVLLMMFGICFVIVCVKSDYSLNDLLISRGFPNYKQILCEFLVHLLAFGLLVLFLLFVGGLLFLITGRSDLTVPFSATTLVSLCARTVPVLIMLAAFNIMIFELSGDLISSVLLHFFCCIGLCYISGCFYPVYSLPLPLQNISRFLPTGIAREFLEGAFQGDVSILRLSGLLVFSGVFFGVAVLVRRTKTLGQRR